ncbi:MAG: hypothetical protein CMM12_02345 [Rhodospirillaceae bacterium]|nr:hypothetical protein [Rhodospirillaceae bacterium]
MFLISETTTVACGQAPPLKNLETVPTAKVAKAINGETMVINSGAEFRFTGIEASKLPLGRKEFKARPLSAEAKKTLH